MSRWLLVSLLVACGGGGGGRSGPREVSKIKYTNTSCDEDCGIDPKAEPFISPDGERDVTPPQPELGPAVTTKAPEPTCNLVAQTLVSLELGNYAEPEERAPKIAVEERRCTAMRLSREDRQCVVDSYDRTSIAYCVPALFPKEPQPVAVNAARCDRAAKQMMTQLEAQLRNQRVPDQRVWERQLLVAIEACRADRWNEAMAQCAEYYVPMAAQNCAYVQPYGMWKRLEARLAAVK
jgi:hypothetical protein